MAPAEWCKTTGGDLLSVKDEEEHDEIICRWSDVVSSACWQTTGAMVSAFGDCVPCLPCVR